MVDSESDDDIYQGIIKLASDKELRNKLGEQGEKRALSEFGWDGQVNKIYKNIIK